MKKTNGRCYYCGSKKWPPRRAVLQPEITIDHLIPLARGGSDDISNLVPACRPCNSAKCAGTLDDFRHSAAQRALKMPTFSRTQIQWMRSVGADLSTYDNFKFWFEVAQKPAQLKVDYETKESGTNALPQ